MVTAEEDAHASAVLSKARAENFPVAPRFLPRAWRDDLMAVYGFARLVDDIGDSDLAFGAEHAVALGLAPEQAGDPLAMLDAFESDLHRVFEDTAGGAGPAGRRGSAAAAREPGHPLLRALVPTVRRRGLTPEPFLALVEANRQDQKVRRYATWGELLAYCELSANPVGHLVLAITGTSTPERVRRSDAVCTGLQIVEHLQDVAEDLARDRIYLPAEDMDRFRVSEADLAAPTANASVRALVAFEADRALGLLDEGTPLVRSVHGRLRLLLAGFTGGGRAAAGALRAARYDVLAGAPKAGAASVLRESWASLRGEG
ncbi:squalene synthase HpnC [Streptomyces tubbatahanensis]|uniref:Squalene synthase HpnC n=1 Tax=Streptomyces tubbatahanensis TaxID=2923272 RepID=A0ABY3XZW3_9ACTN|nr:squalene synthase HpnC [Streptomyces tubbatahanensis]UNT00023.1 squalene synthase HpnC [Streptomyces tubbatahanensis]